MYVHPAGKQREDRRVCVYLTASSISSCLKTSLNFGSQFWQFLNPGRTYVVMQLSVGRDDVRLLSSVFDDAWSGTKKQQLAILADKITNIYTFRNISISFFNFSCPLLSIFCNLASFCCPPDEYKESTVKTSHHKLSIKRSKLNGLER